MKKPFRSVQASSGRSIIYSALALSLACSASAGIFTDGYATNDAPGALALSGDLLLAGNSTTNLEDGHGTVKFYTDLEAGGGVGSGTLIADGARVNFGGSLGLSGNSALIGDGFLTVSGQSNAGVVRYYADITNTSSYTTINAPAPTENAYYGYGVALSGTKALVASDTGSTGSGLNLYYYSDITSGTVTRTVTIAKSTTNFENLALSGSSAVVGTSTGGAKYFADLGASGSYVSLAASAGGSQVSGRSLAISGTDVLLDDVYNGNGRVLYFDMSTYTGGGSMTETSILTASDGAEYDGFGSDIAIDGTAALVGSFCDSNGAWKYSGSADSNN
jgi:hypothetical protein